VLDPPGRRTALSAAPDHRMPRSGQHGLETQAETGCAARPGMVICGDG
jgi:hypothetical protein